MLEISKKEKKETSSAVCSSPSVCAKEGYKNYAYEGN